MNEFYWNTVLMPAGCQQKLRGLSSCCQTGSEKVQSEGPTLLLVNDLKQQEAWVEDSTYLLLAELQRKYKLLHVC